MELFLIVPISYVLIEAFRNLRIFGLNDFLCLAASAGAIILCVCSMIVVSLGAKIKSLGIDANSRYRMDAPIVYLSFLVSCNLFL